MSANLAYYPPTTDSVHMPTFEAFKEALFYYSVLPHESTHWTGAPQPVLCQLPLSGSAALV